MSKEDAPFKMKGNPMQRHFGVGSPVKQDKLKKEGKKKEGTTTYTEGGKSITYDNAFIERQKELDEERRQNKENLIDPDPEGTIEFWKKRGLNPDGSPLKPE